MGDADPGEHERREDRARPDRCRDRPEGRGIPTQHVTYEQRHEHRRLPGIGDVEQREAERTRHEHWSHLVVAGFAVSSGPGWVLTSSGLARAETRVGKACRLTEHRFRVWSPLGIEARGAEQAEEVAGD